MGLFSEAKKKKGRIAESLKHLLQDGNVALGSVKGAAFLLFIIKI